MCIQFDAECILTRKCGENISKAWERKNTLPVKYSYLSYLIFFLDGLLRGLILCSCAYVCISVYPTVSYGM